MLSLGIKTSVMLYCLSYRAQVLLNQTVNKSLLLTESRLLLFSRYIGNLDHFNVKQHKWNQRSLKACMRSIQNHEESCLLSTINIMPVYHLLSKFVLASVMRGRITERPLWALTGRCIHKNPLILIQFTGTFFIFNNAQLQLSLSCLSMH